VRHKEHVRYVRTNNPTSAYALHILQNRREYGTATDTLQLLKARQKGMCMNYMLITEQVSDTNSLYELANTARILPQEP
jgi:hypothetical protein